MDGQLKRGLLEVCVLAAIKTGDSYGYQIIKDMKPYLALSESTLYTVLKRLRKYYHITEAGRQRLEEFKVEWKEILAVYQFVTREDQGNK